MTCKRCSGEYNEQKATDTMKEHQLCVLCVMEWHRKGEGSLEEWSETKRGSHFKI